LQSVQKVRVCLQDLAFGVRSSTLFVAQLVASRFSTLFWFILV